jgi:hypothetical protein
MRLKFALLASTLVTIAAPAAHAQANVAAIADTTTSANHRHQVRQTECEPGLATADCRFQQFADRALETYFRRNPSFATQIGDHRFDADLPDESAAGRAADHAFYTQTLAQLGRFDTAKLSRENQIDAILFADQLRYGLFSLDKLEDWAWDPVQYSGIAGGALFGLSSREFAPLPVRLRSVTGRLEKLPAFLAQVRATLDPARVPPVFATTAADQTKGLNGLIDGLVAQKAALPPADAARLEAAATRAKAAVDDYQHWLGIVLVPQAHGEARIGPALYDEKLRLALNSTLSRAEIRARAMARIAEQRVAMYAAARQILVGRPDAPATPPAPTQGQQQAAIEAALALVNADQVAPDQVIPFARLTLQNAIAFAKAHDLIGFPPSATFKVIEMPEYARGFAVAYADMPGALETDQRGFYAVMPIPTDWTSAQRDSFLREYNKWAINELTLHEGVPGHLLQLAKGNQYHSKLRAVFGSNPMIEGWAMYGEDVMANAGYLDRNPRYTLAHLKFELRATLNAVLDQDYHTGTLTREQAMTLMTKTAFQEEREAAGKWTRMNLSSAQLPVYFVGYSEWTDLRAEAEKRPGFKAHAFHDAALAHGSPPVRFLRDILFDLPID